MDMKNIQKQAFLLQDIYGSKNIDFIENVNFVKTSIFNFLHKNINGSKNRVTSYALLWSAVRFRLS